MRKFAASALCLSLAAMIFSLPVVAQEKKEVKLSLEDSIVRALQNNLTLAVDVINPEIAAADITAAGEIYIPTLALSASDEHSESPSTWLLYGSGVTKTNTSIYKWSLSQYTPTGGTFTLGMDYTRYSTNQMYQIYNPYYYGTVSASLKQPLLKGFGPKIAGQQILVARQARIQSDAELKKTMMTIVYQVEEAYWNLVYAVENLQVTKQSLGLAKELLSKTDKEVSVGQTAPIELLNAQATVAQREAEIIQAEALVRNSDEQFRALLNLRPDGPKQQVFVTPLDKPEMKPIKVTYEEIMDKAMINRPEFDEVKAAIETKNINFTVAKNNLLPALDLNLSYYSLGITGDQLVYQNNDPSTGVVISKIKGKAMNSIRDAMKFLYNNYTAELDLSVPLANIFSKGAYKAAKLDVEKAKAQMKVQEQTIELEVSAAVRDLETNAKEVEAYGLARELAEKRLEAETKKLGVGLTTNYFVLEYQDKLATARSSEIKAVVDYNIALARVAKASGEILKNRNISIH